MKKQYLPPVLDIFGYSVEEGYALSLAPKMYIQHDLDFKPNGLLTTSYLEEDTDPWDDPDAWDRL